EGRGYAVELAAAVVGDHDGRGPVLASELGVLRRQQSFDDDREAVAGEPLQVAPADRCVEAFAKEVALHGEVVGNLEVDAHVALAPADVGDVDREHERGVAGGDSLFDRRFRPRAWAPRRRPGTSGSQRLAALSAYTSPPRRGT